MQLRINAVTGAISLLLASAAFAQSQPPKHGSMTVQQTPMPATTPPSTAPATPATPPTAATPATPAQTQSATTAQPAAQAATAADVKAGVSVYDTQGGVVGKIDSISGTDAVVDTGATRAKIPISSFAKNDKGLVMSMTKADLDAAAKKAAPKAEKTTKPAKKPG